MEHTLALVLYASITSFPWPQNIMYHTGNKGVTYSVTKKVMHIGEGNVEVLLISYLFM